jgi:transcriptional regulator with XRE-family HTH domain
MPSGPAASGPATRAFLDALRDARRRAGLTQKALAAEAGFSHQTTASKFEGGEQRASADEVRAWALACGLGLDATELLLRLRDSSAAEYETWSSAHSRAGGVAAYQRAIGDLENTSEVVYSFQAVMVPGLVQTPGYARDMLTTMAARYGTPLPYEVEPLVSARAARQRVLFGPRPGQQFTVLMLEAALHHPPCSPDVMRGQLAWLARMATESPDGVTVGVVPFGVRLPVYALGGFAVYDHELAVIETGAGDVTLTDPDEVGRWLDQFNALGELAVTGADLVSLLDRVRG